MEGKPDWTEVLKTKPYTEQKRESCLRHSMYCFKHNRWVSQNAIWFSLSTWRNCNALHAKNLSVPILCAHWELFAMVTVLTVLPATVRTALSAFCLKHPLSMKKRLTKQCCGNTQVKKHNGFFSPIVWELHFSGGLSFLKNMTSTTKQGDAVILKQNSTEPLLSSKIRFYFYTFSLHWRSNCCRSCCWLLAFPIPCQLYFKYILNFELTSFSSRMGRKL